MEKQKRINHKKRKEFIFLFCMLALPVLHWCIFWLYVNFSSIMLAFQSQRTGQFTLNNFISFWDSLTSPYGTIKIALRNTIIYFATSLVVILPAGLLLSYFLYKRVLGHSVFRVIFYFPAIVSSVAFVAGFKGFIGPTGPMASIVNFFSDLFKTGVTIPPEGLLARNETATAVIVVYSIWTGFCSSLLIFGGAMTRIPIEILESAKLEGIKPFREFVSIILPLIWSTISTNIVFIFTAIFTSSGPILLFTGGAFETTTISFWIFKEVYGNGTLGGSGSYNLVSATGLVFTALGVPIILLVRWIMDRIPAVEY